MSFFQGLLAGYGIAIPVGAIAVLIIGVALQKGFRAGFMAGSGAASADILFAILAVIAGQAISEILDPIALPLRIISGLVLIGIGIYGLSKLRKQSTTEQNSSLNEQDLIGIYRQFLGLTLLNPLTVTYFVALILGGAAGGLTTAFDRMLFVIGAGIASLSWQTLLAAMGAIAGQKLSPRWQVATILVGNLIVAGFGVNVLVQLLSDRP